MKRANFHLSCLRLHSPTTGTAHGADSVVWRLHYRIRRRARRVRLGDKEWYVPITLTPNASPKPHVCMVIEWNPSLPLLRSPLPSGDLCALAHSQISHFSIRRSDADLGVELKSTSDVSMSSTGVSGTQVQPRVGEGLG
jgi:hypothetical protein